jgi:hypothetical protein
MRTRRRYRLRQERAAREGKSAAVLPKPAIAS